MAQAPINIDTSRKEDAVKTIVYGVVALAVVGIAYWGIIKPILNAIGLTKDKEERQGEQDYAKLSRQQVFSPQLYLNNKDKISITSGTASESAYNIFSAKGVIYDNESLAVGSITGAGSLVNVSYIAYVFDRVYGESMETYLNSFLEPSDWITIDNFIDKTNKF